MLNLDYFPTFCQDKLEELISPINKINSSRWDFRCPLCGDSKKSKRKKRGHYYPNTNSYHCFNCGFNSHNMYYVISLLSGREVSDIKSEYFDYIFRLNKNNKSNILKQNTHKELNNNKIIKNEEIIKPSSWIENNISKKFITDRKINQAPYLPNRFKLYFDKVTKRIVIPWIRDNKVVYYQKRALNNSDLKYLFPKNTNKEIYNKDLIDINFKYIFLVEGALDAIWIKNGVAIGGVSLTDYQKELLQPYFNELVYFLDNQWKDDTSYKNSIKLLNDPKNKVFIWDKNIDVKDTNEYFIKYNKNLFNDENYLKSRIFSGLKGIIELKKYK